MTICRTSVVHCDGCGTHTRAFDDAKQARAHARMVGWHRVPARRIETPFGVEAIRGGDVCPRCFVAAGRP